MNPESKLGGGGTSYMSPLNGIRWRTAIMARQKFVTLDTDREFVLDYNRRPGKVFFKPNDDKMLSTPRGWIDIKSVEKEDGEWILNG